CSFEPRYSHTSLLCSGPRCRGRAAHTTRSDHLRAATRSRAPQQSSMSHHPGNALLQAEQVCAGRAVLATSSDHPHTARSLHELAKLYSIQRRYTEADSLFQRALTIREQKLGADHPDTLATRERYAAL